MNFRIFPLLAAVALTLSACGGSAAPSSSPQPPTEPAAPQETPAGSPAPETEEGPAAPAGAAPETAVPAGAAGEDPSGAEPPAAPQDLPESSAAETPSPAAEPQAPGQPAAAPVETSDGGVLIAYFTWADNAVVADPSAVDVDATTSASVLAPGNAAIMAQYIQEQVGGDLFSIRVTEPYSSDYDECLDRAADEKAENARPALAETVDNMDGYDTVFLGFPNWWYTCPMAIFSFVEEHDLSGKAIVPFVAHGTGGLSSTIRDLTAALPGDVTILDPVGIYRNDMPQAETTISNWLDGLGLSAG